MTKEMKELIKKLKAEGWEVSKNGHIKLRAPWGQLFTASNTPNCPHHHKKLLKDIERYRRDRDKPSE